MCVAHTHRKRIAGMQEKRCSIPFRHLHADAQTCDSNQDSVLIGAACHVERTLRELPLTECEHHLTVWTELGDGRQVIENMRRSAIAISRRSSCRRWRDQPLADTMVGTFAIPVLLDTSRDTGLRARAGRLHATSPGPPAPFSAARQLQSDGSTLKVHLSSCAVNKPFRDQQKLAILATFASRRLHDWRKMHAHLSLEHLLVKLFPKPAALPLHLHITYTMGHCGVFSARPASSLLVALWNTTAITIRSSQHAFPTSAHTARTQRSSPEQLQDT